MTTQVLQSQSTHFPSPSTSTSTSNTSAATSVVPISCSLSSPHNDHLPPNQQHHLQHTTLINNTSIPSSSSVDVLQQVQEQEQEQEQEEQVGLKNNTERGERNNREEEEEEEEREEEGDQLSILALLVTVFRKSLVVVGGCSYSERDREIYTKMEIGSPRNVRHVAHVTFDRFNGFLGLPDEFEPDVPRKPPSASATVFGVSTESMQLSFDSRGNSVPTILLMMQRRLYAKGGLQAEGIFRINADNTQEQYVREQLNKGIIADSVDVHSLAGLIKAWFRELPKGVLDPLSPEQVMQSESEEECTELVGLLPSTEAALLDWAINLMADVAQLESLNKMSPRNIAMVFAPNMTQMSDPLTALMYVVQVMNFLRTLITKTLREREDSIVENPPASRIEPSDENGHGSSSLLPFANEADEIDDQIHVFAAEEPALESPSHSSRYDSTPKSGAPKFLTSIENIIITDGNEVSLDNCRPEVPAQLSSFLTDGFGLEENDDGSSPNETAEKDYCEFIPGQSRKKGSKKANERGVFRAAGSSQKTKGTGNDNRINSRSERTESWR